MRLFFAIPIPVEARVVLVRMQAVLWDAAASVNERFDRVSFTRPDHMHVTLKFLGDVEPDGRIEELRAATRGVDWSVGPVWTDGISHFPPRGPVNVITSPLRGDFDALARVVDEVERIAERVGVSRERRPFVPHVTIARPRGRLTHHHLRPFVDRPGLVGIPFQPDAAVLFRSELLPEGPRYSEVLRVPLAAKNR